MKRFDAKDDAFRVKVDCNEMLLPFVAEVIEQLSNILRPVDHFHFALATSNDPNLLTKDEHRHKPFGFVAVEVKRFLKLLKREISQLAQFTVGEQ